MNGRVWIESDVFDIDRRIKEGDESGWRGDPTMFLQWNIETRMFEVWGSDARGTRYLACSHHECNHVLLQKLVAGDPRRHDVIQEVLDANERAKVEREAEHREKRMEAHEKLQWGIRQDFGHLLGGKQGVHSMYVPKKKASA